MTKNNPFQKTEKERELLKKLKKTVNNAKFAQNYAKLKRPNFSNRPSSNRVVSSNASNTIK